MAIAHQLLNDPNGPNVPVELPINDAAIEQKVFAHASYTGNLSAAFEYAPGQTEHNQSAALRGDIILKDMVVTMIQETYPYLTPGKQTDILSTLLSNETLAQIATRFGFHQRLLAAAHQTHEVQTGTKARATVFEAYIAGLIISGTAREVVFDFVAAIFGPLLYNEYMHLRPVVQQSAPGSPTAGAQGIAVPAVNENWVGKLKEYNEGKGYPHTNILYDDHQVGPSNTGTWYSTVEVFGTAAGHGSGTTKKAAENSAAAMAWPNRASIWAN